LQGPHPFLQASLTRLSLARGYVRSEIRYVGMRGQSQPLRCSIKQVYTGQASVLHAKPFHNSVEATITSERRGPKGQKEHPMSHVFVLDTNKQPLDPLHPARARILLRSGGAAVFKRYPFTILLKTDREHRQPSDYRIKLILAVKRQA
jgi:hypothetical protein